MENLSQLLLDMAAVHSFYISLLKDKLGFEIPVPQDIQGAIGSKGQIQESVDQLQRWLALLDLAIAPVMIRDGPPARKPRKPCFATATRSNLFSTAIATKPTSS